MQSLHSVGYIEARRASSADWRARFWEGLVAIELVLWTNCWDIAGIIFGGASEAHSFPAIHFNTERNLFRLERTTAILHFPCAR